MLAIPGLSADPLVDWRIVGGQDADDGQFPFIVSLRLSGSHSCGGSIINESYILTAAHCISGYVTDETNICVAVIKFSTTKILVCIKFRTTLNNIVSNRFSFRIRPSWLTVVVGTSSLSSGGQPHKVSKIISHQNFNPRFIENDVALLKLFRPLVFTKTVQQIALETENIKVNENVTLIGWGKLNSRGRIPNKLQRIQLQTESFEKCRRKLYPLRVVRTQICTRGFYNYGACQGDSGGPLIGPNGKQIGIVSWGRPCAIGYPDVFTKVSSYVNWIRANMQPFVGI